MQTPDAVTTYYGFLNGERPLDDVPFHDEVSFRSPNMAFDGSAPLTEALTMLGSMTPAGSLELRHQSTAADTTMTFYDFEFMGRRPMAERIRVLDGAISEIELIFDAPAAG